MDNLFRRVAHRFERGEWCSDAFHDHQRAHTREQYQGDYNYRYAPEWIAVEVPERHSYCAVGGLRQEVYGNPHVPMILTRPIKSLWVSLWAWRHYGFPSIMVMNDNWFRNADEAAEAFNQMADDWDAAKWRVWYQLWRWMDQSPPVRDDLPIIMPNALKVHVPADWVEDAVCESIVADVYADA